MNIKINKEQFERLYEHKEEEYIFGSQLYGTAREGSDTDILVVYDSESVFIDSIPIRVLGLPNIHQFQYDDEENNRQYIFTDSIQFAKNMQSGDSTINAEIMMFMDETVQEDIHIFRTFKIIKAFIGFAKRDLRYKKKGYEAHVARGLYIADSLIHNTLPTLEGVREVMVESSNLPVTLYERIQKTLRQKVNKMYDDGEIPLYCIPKTDDDLLNLLLQSNNTKEFKYDNK